jgi:hypothetical protein
MCCTDVHQPGLSAVLLLMLLLLLLLLLLLRLLLQMIQRGTNNVYPEVEGLSILLGFKTQNAGCCKVRLSTSSAMNQCWLAEVLEGTAVCASYYSYLVAAR